MFDTTSNPTFWQAIEAGDVGTVRAELNRQPELVLASRAGRPAAHLAVHHRRTAVARLLVQRGADLLARDRDGLTLPERAAFEGPRQLLEALFFELPALGLRQRSRSTLLLWAVAGGNLEAASYLLACGANPHARDAVGRNAVAWAVLGNQPGMILWLARQGVSVVVTDLDGDSAADLAARAGRRHCLRVLTGLGTRRPGFAAPRPASSPVAVLAASPF